MRLDTDGGASLQTAVRVQSHYFFKGQVNDYTVAIEVGRRRAYL